MRRGGMVLILAAMVLLLALPVSAVGELGSVRVTAAEAMAGSRLRLSYVGILTEHGLQLTGEFGGGFVPKEDLQTRELAQWLQEQKHEALEKEIGDDGTVMFTGLPEGVYLLHQTEAAPGYYPIVPMLIRLPEADGTWFAQVSPKVEKEGYNPPGTGQSMAPVLGMIGMVLSASGIGICSGVWRKRRKT